MRFLSMFSGIEAASVAWKPLGWTCEAVCEIEPFSSALLSHHYPNVPNLGNVETADFESIGSIDLAVFGSPCQSYSIAGKRLGLDDPRGNLALIAGKVLYRKRPRWFVFENVPGLLSSDAGWDFGTLLAAFAGYQSGSVFEPPEGGWKNSGIVESANGQSYGLAWRVLDAQFVRTQSHPRAVPQRRRRVFVVGHSGGDWRRAAAVLFEREGMRRDSPPSRKPGKDVAPTISARTQGGGGLGTDFDCDGGLVTTPTAAELAMRSLRRDVRGQVCEQTGGPRQPDATRMSEMRNGRECDVFDGGLVAKSLCAGGHSNNPLDENLIAHALRGEGFDASEDGTGRGTPIVPVAIQERAVSDNPDAGPDGVGVRTDGAAYTLEARTVPQAVALPWAVRRLIPEECEKLQGFKPGYTQVPYRGKPAADGPRYKALGNSFAVNVVRWIGERIKIVEDILG